MSFHYQFMQLLHLCERLKYELENKWIITHQTVIPVRFDSRTTKWEQWTEKQMKIDIYSDGPQVA